MDTCDRGLEGDDRREWLVSMDTGDMVRDNVEVLVIDGHWRWRATWMVRLNGGGEVIMMVVVTYL